jgi:rhodanese-related sulfurtransferase
MPKISLLLFIAASVFSQAPSPSREERRQAKVRSEYLKATVGIHSPTIKADSLKSQLGDTNLILVDVRQPVEQMVSMLPGALTPYEFAQKFKHGFPATKRVVVYCTIGHRSGKYAEELQVKNVPVQNLEGGILAWTHAGGLLTRDSAGIRVPTKKAHVYSGDMQKWISLDYEAVW